ncbi:hypothetical protein ACFQ9R_05620 [Nocardia sp. NPDC056541]|uniref:hypothetical protein n=1 Tax=Nocardia sp. NPDC056541 TaxID=3345860 RepID=UPI0036700FCA
MSSKGDAQFDAALRAALAASDPLDAGDKGKGGAAKSDGKGSGESPKADVAHSDHPRGGQPSIERHDAPARYEKERPPAPAGPPSGVRPTATPPSRSVKPRRPSRSQGRPRGGLGAKVRGGAGLAGGLAMGALASGVDWRQAVADPKAALSGLGSAALAQGKDYLAGMADPANLSDAVSQVRDTAGGARDKASPGKSNDAKPITDETKALKDRTSALRGDVKNLGTHAATSQKMTENVDKSSKGFDDLAKAHKDSAGAQKNVEGASNKWDKSQGKLNKAVGKSVIGKIVAAIEVAIVVIGLLIEHWDSVKKAFDTVKKNVLEPVGDYFKKVFAACLAPFTTVIDEVKDALGSLGSGIGGLFAGVVNQVADIVAVIGSVVAKIEFSLPGWLGGATLSLAGLGGAMTSWAASARMADGGVVRGPGGPREDRVPVLASNGEFVVNAAATARYGPLLESINKDTLNVGGRDAQVVASLGLSRVKPAQALPDVATTHRFDRSTTINLTTTQHDGAYLRSKAVAAQRDITYAAGRR